MNWICGGPLCMSSPWPSKTCCVYRPQGIATPPLLYSYSAAAPGPAHRVVCRSKFPWSIKSSPPALPFDTLVTGMVWPIVFPNQITEMHILHEVRTQKRKLARVWVSHECREGAVNGHQRVVKLGANTANTAAFRNESLCME